jgi:hypothetical protein
MAKSQTTTPDKPPARYVPEACPVCQSVPPRPESLSRGQPQPTAEETLRGHLETHRPQSPCRHPHSPGQEHREWVLDWDLIVYPRSDLCPWYCRPCGYYLPQG